MASHKYKSAEILLSINPNKNPIYFIKTFDTKRNPYRYCYSQQICLSVTSELKWLFGGIVIDILINFQNYNVYYVRVSEFVIGYFHELNN